MSYYNVLAIFNELELAEIESLVTLTQLGLSGEENVIENMVKAVTDYRYLINLFQTSQGLTQQVIKFLLDDASITPEGVELFLSKLEIWLMIVESKKEQRVYAEIIHKYRGIDEREVLALRYELIDVLRELEDIRTAKKEKKRHHNWEVHDLTRYEAPMQLQPNYEGYELHMKKYGESFESSSFFNAVPNLKEKFNKEQPSYYEAFESYYAAK